MLKQRLLTALVLIPLMVWAIWSLPSPYFALLMAAVALLGAWEWASLVAGTGGMPLRILFVAGTGLVLAAIDLLSPSGWSVLIGSALCWWVLALVLVIRYPAGGDFWTRRPLLGLAAGLLVLAPAWAALVRLQAGDSGAAWLLFLMTLIWLADSAAYFAGRRWGQRKLAPRVSPGKTWEGLYGALGATLALAIAAVAYLRPSAGHAVGLVLVCLVTVLASVLGDLTESLVKRNAGVKDSGHLLPGHGGILDRIDSLTAAAPVFVVGVQVLGMLR